MIVIKDWYKIKKKGAYTFRCSYKGVFLFGIIPIFISRTSVKID